MSVPSLSDTQQRALLDALAIPDPIEAIETFWLHHRALHIPEAVPFSKAVAELLQRRSTELAAQARQLRSRNKHLAGRKSDKPFSRQREWVHPEHNE